MGEPQLPRSAVSAGGSAVIVNNWSLGDYEKLRKELKKTKPSGEMGGEARVLKIAMEGPPNPPFHRCE